MNLPYKQNFICDCGIITAFDEVCADCGMTWKLAMKQLNEEKQLQVSEKR